MHQTMYHTPITMTLTTERFLITSHLLLGVSNCLLDVQNHDQNHAASNYYGANQLM